MKIEVAFQQVMTEFNGQKPCADDGSVIVSNLDGVGEIEQPLDDLKEALRHGHDDLVTKRKHAKRIAAMAIRFMVDCC